MDSRFESLIITVLLLLSIESKWFATYAFANLWTQVFAAFKQGV